MRILQFLLFSVAFSENQSYVSGIYKSYRVLRVIPQTDAHVSHLNQLAFVDNQLDYWMSARRPQDEVIIMVAPHKYEAFVEGLDDLGIEHAILIEDVEKLLDNGKRSEQTKIRQSAAEFDYNAYHSYDEIMAEMDVLASKCRKDLGIICETYSIGKSYEGRDQRILRVQKDKLKRHSYWVDSLIHSREWLGGATNLKIANHIITNYNTDPEATRLIDDGDWYFLFVHNPDGYAYTWEQARLWRKNRYNNSNTNPSTNCTGIDLNRNYDFRWGSAGTSADPCSNIYRGNSPADQIEVQNVQREIVRLAPQLRAFVSIHTAGRMILCPWGSILSQGNSTQCEYLEEPERSDVENLAKLMAKNIEEHFNHSKWRGGNVCETIYPATGSTMDFARGVGMIKYSFTPELRDRDANGTVYGFVAPPTEIEPSFQEMWDGFVTMVDTISPKDECHCPPPTCPSVNGVESNNKPFLMWFIVALVILKFGDFI